MAACGVLFVCLGNICRSPTAEGVLRTRLAQAGLERHAHVDSAGTGAWHVGKAPDPRAQAAAARRGHDLSALRARQVGADDFVRFDYVLAMDDDNLAVLRRRCPPALQARLGALASWCSRFQATHIPDPWYGDEGDFEHVLDLVEDAVDGLMRELRGRVAR